MKAVAAAVLLGAAGALAASAVVGTVQCEKFWDGKVALYKRGGVGPNGVGLKTTGTTGSPLYVFDNQEPSQAFSFWRCDSKFMNTHSTTGSGGSTTYGQLRVGNKCVGPNALYADGDQRLAKFVLQDCTFSDDSGQALQTWRLLSGKAASGELDFVNGGVNDDGSFRREKYIYSENANAGTLQGGPRAEADGSSLSLIIS